MEGGGNLEQRRLRGNMGTVFKYLKGCSMCGRGEGSLFQRSEGEKVAGCKSSKARTRVQAAMGGEEFPMLGRFKQRLWDHLSWISHRDHC